MKEEVKKYMSDMGKKGGKSKSLKKIKAVTENLKKAWAKTKERQDGK